MASRTKAKSRESRVKSQTEQKETEKPRVVFQYPTCCPKCGSDKLPAIAGVRPTVRDIPGEIKGHEFASVRWQHSACADCGQRVTVRQHLV